MQKPQQGDYGPGFAKYVGLVKEGDVIAQLQQQERDMLALYYGFTEEQGEYRYGDGKWSLKELLAHVSDTERIMTYRLLCAARGDETSLPGFDENLYVAGTDFNRRSLVELTDEFRAVRAATLALLGGLTDEEFARAGKVNGNRTTAAALAYVTAGHAIHHMNLVRERYLPGLRQ